MRLCYGNGDLDELMQSELAIWNSGCDSILTYSPTTPALSSVATTYDVQYCTTAASACQAGLDAIQSCSINYLGQPQPYSSCNCQPSLLSAEYTCGFLGNVSCEQIPGTLTNLAQYNLCTNFMQVLGGSSGSVSADPFPRPCCPLKSCSEPIIGIRLFDRDCFCAVYLFSASTSCADLGISHSTCRARIIFVWQRSADLVYFLRRWTDGGLPRPNRSGFGHHTVIIYRVSLIAELPRA